MINKISITLVIIDTDSYELAHAALERSANALPFDKIIVFSDNSSRWRIGEVVLIPKIRTIRDYNRLILIQLAERIETDYVLIIQWDGFILNPDKFDKFFFNYDYIGAPIFHPRSGEKIVGNGGFSLRSKKLLKSLVKYTSLINIEDPEDMTICHYMRPTLEDKSDIIYAPVDVAFRFSLEHGRGLTNQPFGFHGLPLLPLVYSKNLEFLIDNLPLRYLDSKTAHYKVLKLAGC